MDDDNYQYLKRKIMLLTGIDLEDYKSKQMRRRLESFISNLEIRNIFEYCRRLETDQVMLQTLRNFITINVSEFFRDLAVFERLRRELLPELLDKSTCLNIWSAGCSRGQEAYSVAMLLAVTSPFSGHRILATDIDQGALETAMNGGPYRKEEVKNIPLSLLKKFFVQSDDGFMMNDRIKRHVEFVQHNLLNDEFETGFDLILCRNVTIYFTEKAKARLNRKFFRALREGGILFTGGTEVMLDSTGIGFEDYGISFYRKPLPIVHEGYDITKIRLSEAAGR